MRLNRFLAAAGVGSRRCCDELIAAGRVTINGKICTNFSAQPTARDHVKVDGKLLSAQPPLTIMLYKPAGFVSTRQDVHVRNTIFDLLPQKFSRLFSIGRLDAQSEGLLLLTNDGDLAQKLTHPGYKIDKEYEVTLDRAWDRELGPKLLNGIFLDGKRARIERLRSQGEDPFDAFQVPQAALALKQGFGRLIRHAQDRGIVAVLDSRLSRRAYGKRLLQSLPPARLLRSVEEARAFFSAPHPTAAM